MAKRDKHEHDRGLAHDLRTMSRLADRRQVLRFLAGASLLPIIGCGDNELTTTTTGTDPTVPGDGGTTTSGACAEIPNETAGPFPGDGSNGPNALTTSGIVRSDIKTSVGSSSGTAVGIPLTIALTLVNTNAACSPLAGYAIYLWHCDRDGKYSLYDLPNENYLRGVQGTDAAGVATFSSIFPACYAGRWPHIHFEIFPSLAAATTASGRVKTSQLALPVETCNAVYATEGYSQSVANLSRVSLATDNVFRDGSAQQLAKVVGTVTDGYLATLTVGIAV